MTRTVRAVATFVLAIVLPHQLPAQSLMFRPQTPDITAYLPPVTSVPWLDQKTPVKQQKPKIEASSLTACDKTSMADTSGAGGWRG
jgi:hypothetical protein